MNGSREILVLDGLFDDLGEELAVAAERGWTVRRWDGERSSLQGARVIVHVRTRIDRALLALMPEVRVVGRYGTGLDTVDLEAAAERGITVVGVRDYCIPELSAHTLALAFALDRRVADLARVRLDPGATWQATSVVGSLIPGRRTAAVVGFGAIGQAVTGALVACGMEVRVVTAHGADRAAAVGATATRLEDAISGVGFVFLHAALTSVTAGLIDAVALRRMTPDTILVDTARLGLLDEAAVGEALRDDRIGGLALDARIPSGSPLEPWLDDPRVLVTPHVGWYSARSARELRARTIAASIAAAEAPQPSAADHEPGSQHRRPS